MSFSEKLKKLRKENKITQIELGKAIGKTNRVISYYENEENGTTMPPMEIIEPISKFFNVPIEYFLDDSKTENPKLLFVQKLIDLSIQNKLNWTSLEDFKRENLKAFPSVQESKLFDFIFNAIKRDDSREMFSLKKSFISDKKMIFIINDEKSGDNLNYSLIVTNTEFELGLDWSRIQKYVIYNDEVDNTINKLVQIIDGDKALLESEFLMNVIKDIEE